MKAWYNLLLPLTYPLTWIYRFLFYLDRKFHPPQKLDASMVISVGNLTVGGTGKTPFVSFLGDWIEKDRHNHTSITVLSHGYRSRLSAEGAEVQLNSEASDVGDEPLWLKNTHPKWQILIGKDRIKAFDQYCQDDSTVVILDDGFQHHKILKNLNIILIDSVDLLSNGFLLPAGPLREPLTALRRADKIVFTKYRDEFKPKCDELIEKIIKINPDLDIYKSTMLCKGLKLVAPKHDKVETIEYLVRNKILPFKDKKILAFCGIGNPSSFRRWFENPLDPLYAPKLEFRQFPDHFEYTDQAKKEITDRKSEYDFFITTEKDATKWNKHHMELEKLYSVSIGLRLETYESSKTPTIQSFLEI